MNKILVPINEVSTEQVQPDQGCVLEVLQPFAPDRLTVLDVRRAGSASTGAVFRSLLDLLAQKANEDQLTEEEAREALRQQVRERAGRRCEYCHLPDWLPPLEPFHLEHIIARQHGG